MRDFKPIKVLKKKSGAAFLSIFNFKQKTISLWKLIF